MKVVSFSRKLLFVQEFIKHSIQRGCVLALYIFALDKVKLPDFHLHSDDLKREYPSEQRLEKFYEIIVLDMQWLSSMVPT